MSNPRFPIKNNTQQGSAVTRQTIPVDKTAEFQLPTGYAGEESSPTDILIPPCGISDIDRSVFMLFERDLKYTSKTIQTKDTILDLKKPGVMLASGERAGLIKKMQPLRDKATGALMLPLIAIRQLSISQTYEDMLSRGMNQTTGEIVVKRRLSGEDKNYQSILNKIGLMNLTTLPGTRRDTGENKKDQSIVEGMVLDPKLGNNIYEIISIPQPQFITVKYEITFWTLDIRHMNYMVETFLSAQLPQGKFFKLFSKAGYWFIGFAGDSFEAEDNFDDYTEEKRLVKKKMEFEVKGYILAANGPNNMVPVKRYFSAPSISMDVKEGMTVRKKDVQKYKIKENNDKFTLSDSFEEDENQTQEPTLEEKYLLKAKRYDSKTGRVKEVTVRQVENRNGETIYTASDRDALLEALNFPK